MPFMRGCGAAFIGFMLPCAAFAQGQAPVAPVSLHVTYETYAAGLHIAEVSAELGLGPWTYQMLLGYHTTGMTGFFVQGHQSDRVDGSWSGRLAEPSRFVGRGEWHGEGRLAEIDYQRGKPVVRQLVPPNADEREPVPEALRDHSIDMLSALAQLVRVVAATGRCETSARTYDGRRAVEIEAHTVGEEMLESNSRSHFAGKALRCDFSGHLLAGFKSVDDRERDSKPMRGSAWLAPVTAGGPPLPVRMAFETRWFGDAIMYLTGIGPASDLKVAEGN
jgi:hypothetical protein